MHNYRKMLVRWNDPRRAAFILATVVVFDVANMTELNNFPPLHPFCSP